MFLFFFFFFFFLPPLGFLSYFGFLDCLMKFILAWTLALGSYYIIFTYSQVCP
ncbi:hypothetical protein V1525DRAFT_150233 [Lipomyces kononenkoae]|uniref:Uncharacterized protein n=1 Tax=Lipomyces kononenkoae TaxID=34357 RepID=A0ACC3SQR5_LIPKO